MQFKSDYLANIPTFGFSLLYIHVYARSFQTCLKLQGRVPYGRIQFLATSVLVNVFIPRDLNLMINFPFQHGITMIYMYNFTCQQNA